jgi:hypothetical protein
LAGLLPRAGFASIQEDDTKAAGARQLDLTLTPTACGKIVDCAVRSGHDDFSFQSRVDRLLRILPPFQSLQLLNWQLPLHTSVLNLQNSTSATAVGRLVTTHADAPI